MEKELTYFYIENEYGGNQDWFTDILLKVGGCAALSACDSCIYLELRKGMSGLYPFDKENLTKKDYKEFGKIMKPYLRPRRSGIDRVEIYMDGFGQYLKDIGNDSLSMTAFHGEQPASEARKAIMEQIDNGYVIPYLMLKNVHKTLQDYEWHWFMLTGYACDAEFFKVKAGTYGEAEWLDFDHLWDTGYEQKGGFVCYEKKR